MSDSDDKDDIVSRETFASTKEQLRSMSILDCFREYALLKEQEKKLELVKESLMRRIPLEYKTRENLVQNRSAIAEEMAIALIPDYEELLKEQQLNKSKKNLTPQEQEERTKLNSKKTAKKRKCFRWFDAIVDEAFPPQGFIYSFYCIYYY